MPLSDTVDNTTWTEGQRTLAQAACEPKTISELRLEVSSVLFLPLILRLIAFQLNKMYVDGRRGDLTRYIKISPSILRYDSPL